MRCKACTFDIAEVLDLMSEDELELDNLGGYKKINTDTGEEETIRQKNALFAIISDTDSIQRELVFISIVILENDPKARLLSIIPLGEGDVVL